MRSYQIKFIYSWLYIETKTYLDKIENQDNIIDKNMKNKIVNNFYTSLEEYYKDIKKIEKIMFQVIMLKYI